MSQDILYTCRICYQWYETRKEAVECQEQPFDTGKWKVGDIVVVPSVYTSYPQEGPLDWLACIVPPLTKEESTDHFSWVPHYMGWWVVTALHHDPMHPHDAAMTLGTKWWPQGKVDERYGWTPCVRTTHYRVYLPTDKIQPCWRVKSLLPMSDRLRKEAAEMAAKGTVATYLL